MFGSMCFGMIVDVCCVWDVGFVGRGVKVGGRSVSGKVGAKIVVPAGLFSRK